MIDDEVLKAIAEAHRENRYAEKRLQELVGDFITRTHTVADVIRLMDMVAWRAESRMVKPDPEIREVGISEAYSLASMNARYFTGDLDRGER